MDEKMIEVAEYLWKMRTETPDKEMTEKELTAWEILRDELAEW
jgi:hypothetical protein